MNKTHLWLNQFRYSPLKPLLEAKNEVITYFVERDLLDVASGDFGKIRELPQLKKIISSQGQGGFWPGKQGNNPFENYDLIETWRQLRYLVEQYQLDRDCPAVAAGVEYVLKCQSPEGDIRGMLANQYAPYYTGAILATVIKAGYDDDHRVKKGLEWLLKMRQEDGGWVIGSPGMINKSHQEIRNLLTTRQDEPSEDYDWSKPFSAAGTGMAIRALIAHQDYRNRPETIKAATLLKSKFLKKDNYSSYHHQDNWIRFQYPYWWNSLVGALDAITMIDQFKDDPDVKAGLAWLIAHQKSDGLWKVSYSRIHKELDEIKTREAQLWLTLTICRIFKRIG